MITPATDEAVTAIQTDLQAHKEAATQAVCEIKAEVAVLKAEMAGLKESLRALQEQALECIRQVRAKLDEDAQRRGFSDQNSPECLDLDYLDELHHEIHFEHDGGRNASANLIEERVSGPFRQTFYRRRS